MEQLTTKLESTDTTESDLEALMKMYSSPAKKVEDATVQPTAPTPPPVTVAATPPPAPTQQSVDPEAPYGRYQRGKLKGQPRKTPYISTKGVSSVPASVAVQAQPQQAKLSGMLISAGLFLTLINMLIPMAISLANNYFEKDPKKHIDPKKLKLTNDQIKELDPVVDAVLKQVELRGNPTWILLLGLLAGYGMNFMMIKMSQNDK